MPRKKSFSVFTYLFSSFFTVGAVIFVLFSLLLIISYTYYFYVDIKSDIDYDLDAVSAYFDQSYATETERLFAILSEAYVFDNLIDASEDKGLFYKPLCEQLLSRCIKGDNSIYISFRFLDNNGNEKIIVEKTRRTQEHYSPAQHPKNEFYDRMYSLYRRLDVSAPGLIFVEGPFIYDSKNIFLIGMAKKDITTGGLDGVFIAHCDMANLMNYIAGNKKLGGLYGEIVDSEGKKIAVKNATGVMVMAEAPAWRKKYFYSASRELKIGSPPAAICSAIFSVTLRPLVDYIIKTAAWMALIFLLLAVILAVVSSVLSKGLANILGKFAAVVQEFADGNLSERLAGISYAPREIQNLGTSINKMADDLEKSTVSIKAMIDEISLRKQTEEKLKVSYEQLEAAQEHLVQAEKLELIGRMAAGVAHEVKNPLGIILQGVEYLESMPIAKQENYPQILDIMKGSVKKADYIVRALLDFSRASELSLGRHDINIVIDKSVRLAEIEREIKSKDITIDTKLEPALPEVVIDERKMEQVFLNLLTNSVQAMEKGGRIHIRSYLSELKVKSAKIGNRATDYFRYGDKAVIVEIEDTGRGISRENMKKVFEPFFSTKKPAQGTGLGLSVSVSIIEMHKGIIDITSEEGKGTKVTIALKAAIKE
ncbi:MAG: hypothetical protein JW946_05015 [Candidatus Omnitrophica bacterium]|nr:hypothetical protein [Candidatus Omnitrophota bacterium]